MKAFEKQTKRWPSTQRAQGEKRKRKNYTTHKWPERGHALAKRHRKGKNNPGKTGNVHQGKTSSRGEEKGSRPFHQAHCGRHQRASKGIGKKKNGKV